MRRCGLSRWNAATSPKSGAASGLVATAVATGLPGTRRTTMRRGRGRHLAKYHRRVAGATGRQSPVLVPGSCLKQPADSRLTGSCFVFVGGAAHRLAGTEVLTSGQQLAGRLRALAASSGLPATAIAFGRISPVWVVGTPCGLRHWRKATTRAITPDSALRVRKLLRHNRVYTGYAPAHGSVAGRAFAERSRFFEVFPAQRFKHAVTCSPRDERPARLRQPVAEVSRFAAHRRPRPPATRVWILICWAH